MKYPNQYNADADVIEIDQHVRAYTAANLAANDETLSDETRACHRDQAEAELKHIAELRARS